MHTVYGGAHLFKADAAQKLGAVALRTLHEHAPDAATLAAAIGLDPALAERIYPRVVDKLTREPVEDFRIDFEDGFGNRPDHEEDGHAQIAANEVAAGLRDGTLPPSIGIRIKPLTEELKRRSLRTFDLFLTRLLDRSDGVLPPNFVVTLPKITAPEQVAALASACDAFEYWRGLPAGVLRFELMVETTQSIFAADGTVALPRLVAEGGGRIVGAHFGTYDYTAACSITAAHQHMLHPACDFAKHVMQVALAGTGIWLSDGATNIMPIGAREVVHRAWRLHAWRTCGTRSSTASTRAGTCTRRSCRRGTRPSTRSSSKGSTRPRIACATSSRRRPRRRSSATCSTMRRPGRGC